MTTTYFFNPKKLAEAVEAAGLTVAVAAAMVGASKQQWKQWAEGKHTPNVRKLVEICNVLNVPPEYFFDRAHISNGIGNYTEGQCLPSQEMSTNPNEVAK